MRNSVEILELRAGLKEEAIGILDKCKAEIRDLTEEESARVEEIKKELEELKAELDSLDVVKPQDEEKLNEVSVSKEDTEARNLKNKSIVMEFRLLKAINDVANNRNLDEIALEVSKRGAEEMRKSGLSFGGQIQLPVAEPRSAITVASEGSDVVATEVYNILEPLRAKNVLVQAGAKFMTGLTGDVQVPVMGGSNVTWESETTAAKDGAATFTGVKLQPKRLTAYVDVSKQFLAQESVDAENMLRADIVNAINSKLEATILGSAQGSTTQPQGLFYSSSALTKITDFAGITKLESGVEDANVMGDCVYIMSNKAKAGLRVMPKGAKSTENVLEAGQVDGTLVLNTSNVPDTNLAFGDFSNLAIGQWGATDLTVDPYTKAAEGMVRIVVNAYFDAKVLREGAIAVAKL